MKKKIIIAGGTGFLGKALNEFFGEQGYDVFVLTRSPKSKTDIYWDGQTVGEWVDILNGADVLINLTGKSVDCRYTRKNKEEILSSRINSTNVLHTALKNLKNPPKVWLNASSATIYMHAETIQMTEDRGSLGDDFSMNVCKKWEAAFFEEELPKTRSVALRTSIVFGKEAGAFPVIKRLAKFFMGGKQGSGRQMVSWIHIDDFCRAVDFIIKNDCIVGVINVVGPAPINNADFMKLVRRHVGVPFGLNQPVWLLDIGARIIGTEIELLLKSRNVVPARLLEKGFEFKYATMEECLEGLG